MSGKTYLTNQPYFKPTYHEALKYIVPKYLIEDDLSTFGTEVDVKDQIINGHLNFADSIATTLNISSIAGTVYSALDTIEGIAPYFIKQNNLTNITQERFETKILSRLNKSFNSFNTESEWSDYVEETLLPSIRLNSPSSTFVGAENPSATHIFLIQNLSWLYFLNTSGTTFNPSSTVKDLLVSKTFKGQPILINDCMKALAEYVWKNNLTSFYPSELFSSGTGTYVSGTQQLDKLKTWMDIVYSPLFSDRSDFSVRDAFELYIENNIKLEQKIPAGPFQRLLRAISFLAFDISNDSELLESLYDIEDCPDEYLPLIANLIGWDLFGSNPERWRLQLRNAVEVYKRVGTKKSVQFALNTVFPKDIFNIESRIAELWESYIPFLIHYSLATESSLFSNRSAWTPSLAASLNVSGFSSSSLDENIKLATDRIILETYLKFKDKFRFPHAEKGFYYRGRNYQVPPFEEYPYYVNVELTLDMINFIADRLACFGVRKEFALQFRDYVASNTINADDEPRAGSWLFFTSGYCEPPNLTKIISNLNNDKFEYTSLWSGKSSHFKLLFDAVDFDFTKVNTDDIDSGDAVILASKITQSFVPAHSIPLISLQLSAEDSIGFDSSCLPIIDINKPEYNPGAIGRNFQASGLSLKTYKRGISPSGNLFFRNNMVSVEDPLYENGDIGTNLERNTIRRRSFEKVMPMKGYYDRTGLNMPTSFYMLSSLSGIPLGFIPSSLSFQPVNDHINLPDVYSRCGTIDASTVFYGYAASNTLQARGHTGLGMVDYHNTRGQLEPVYAIMHNLKEQAKLLEASAYLYTSTVNTEYEFSVSNVYQSLANIATDTSGWFPNSTSDYYNFSFGKEFHKLYKVYTNEFERHKLAEHLYDIAGPNIFSHVYGPILWNHDFEYPGSFGGSYITSSLSAIQSLNLASPVFSQSLDGGTYIASSGDSMYIETFEFVNSGILNGVELIQTSGASINNAFSIIRIPGESRTSTQDPYMFDNTFIQITSLAGTPRVRFDLKKYSVPSPSPLSGNFLLPDCNYRLDFKFLHANRNGNPVGKKFACVWIHTKPEDGHMWSFTKDGVWVQHSSNLTRLELFSKYLNIKLFDEKVKSQNEFNELEGTSFECLDNILGGSNSSPILNLSEKDFNHYIIDFNTKNSIIEVPFSYNKNVGQVHRKDQEYVIEVLPHPIPSKVDDFMLIDSVSINNTTLKKWSELLVLDTCPQHRVATSKEQLHGIFSFFNDLAGKSSHLEGLQTRNATTGDSSYSENIPAFGGSRLDYRTRISWNELTNTIGGVTGNPRIIEINIRR